MRTLLVFAVTVLAAGAAILSAASTAATFAECKRATVISNWPQLLNELGKDEFDALIRHYPLFRMVPSPSQKVG